MRSILALILMTAPAAAWEFTPGLPCLLTHAEGGMSVELTHDPTQPLFSIALRRDIPWPNGDIFSIRFDGPAGLTITTNRHSLSDGGRTLIVVDRGFGNVLRGLSQNRTATALIADEAVGISLNGAAAPTRAFWDCAVDPAV